jgi:hypothetical protein
MLVALTVKEGVTVLAQHLLSWLLLKRGFCNLEAALVILKVYLNELALPIGLILSTILIILWRFAIV